MKKTNLMIVAVIASIGFTACNGNKAANQDAEVLSMYVDSVDNLTPVYTVENWTLINDGYQERALKAEASNASLQEADRAKAEASKAKYATLKAKYEIKLKENEATANLIGGSSNFRTILRNRLFGEGKVGNDMKFDFVTAANIHDVYKNFVNTVEDNKKEYTREDWDEIKVLYEALDTRKNAVEKDLASSDNFKIARLKIRFAAVKATHRFATKGVENAEAKQ